MIDNTAGSYMIGKLHGTLFAFEVADVEGVNEFEQEKVTPLDCPLANGVVLYHFQRIPLLDTNQVLGLPMPGGQEKSTTLILRVSHGMVGIPLDEILHMVQVNPTDIQPLGIGFAAGTDHPFSGVIQTSEGNAIIVDKKKAVPEKNLIEILNNIYQIKDSFATNYVFNLGVVEYLAKKKEIELVPFQFNANQSLQEIGTEDVYKDMIDCLRYLGVSHEENKDRVIIAADVYLVSKKISKILEDKVGTMDAFRKTLKLRSNEMENIFGDLHREINAGDVYQLSEALKDGLEQLNSPYRKAS